MAIPLLVLFLFLFVWARLKWVETTRNSFYNMCDVYVRHNSDNIGDCFNSLGTLGQNVSKFWCWNMRGLAVNKEMFDEIHDFWVGKS